MEKEFLGDRRKALEEEFFRKQNEKQLAAIRAQRKHAERLEALARASGLSDEALIQRLISLGIDAETVAALALVPLVEVAWADAKIEETEKKAVLSAALEHGIARGSESSELLEGWLETPPSPRLLDAWTDYVRALCAELDESERSALRRDLLGRARTVAEAAGGILGLGAKISDTEEQMLALLEGAFPE